MNLKNFQKLLKIEQGAKNAYDGFLRDIKEPDFRKNITYIRDEEIEHIALVKELLLILKSKFVKKSDNVKYNKKHLEEREKLINATAEVLHAKINLISLLEKFDALIKELRDLNKLKSEFISITAHQLKNPLTSMKWFFDLIMAGTFGKLDQKQKDLVKDIYQSNEKLVDLVDDLLKISRLEGEQALKSEKIDIADLCQEIFKKYKVELESKKLNVIFTGPKTPLWVDSFPNLVENVIDNLISNAIKYTSKNGKIKISFKREGENILITVADTGIGILEKDKARIFEKFFRAKNANQEKGTGLGLWIAQESAKQCGGKIWFEPNKPNGTIFYFSLPVESS